MANNIGARLVNAEHDQRPFLWRKRIRLEKAADECTHEREISGVTGKLELLLIQAGAGLRMTGAVVQTFIFESTWHGCN